MRNDQHVTTLQHDPGATHLDIFLSQNRSTAKGHLGEPMMVAQLYDGDDGNLIDTVWFHELQARRLRNHLNRFLAHCQRERSKA